VLIPSASSEGIDPLITGIGQTWSFLRRPVALDQLIPFGRDLLVAYYLNDTLIAIFGHNAAD
jgi:hypothetical protein